MDRGLLPCGNKAQHNPSATTSSSGRRATAQTVVRMPPLVVGDTRHTHLVVTPVGPHVPPTAVNLAFQEVSLVPMLPRMTPSMIGRGEEGEGRCRCEGQGTQRQGIILNPGTASPILLCALSSDARYEENRSTVDLR